jgi:tetratricopeptide (TPR) repeat protein
MFTDDRLLRESLSQEAIAVARSTGDPLALADVLAEGGPTNGTPWTLDQAEAYVLELLDLAPTLNDPYRLAIANLWHYILGFFAGREPGAGVASLREAERLGRDLGQPTVQWMTGVWQAVHTQMQGRTVEALTLAERAFTAGQACGQPDAWTWYAAQLTTIYRETGRLAELTESIENEVAAMPGLPAWEVVMAQVLVEVGRTEEARAIVLRLVDVDTGSVHIPQDVVWIFGVAALLEVAATLGELAAVELLYEQLLPFRHLTVHAGVAFLGSAEHYLGLATFALGRPSHAIAHLEAAIAAHERLKAKLFLGLSHAELARVLTAGGAAEDHDRIASARATAVALAEETGGTCITRRLP